METDHAKWLTAKDVAERTGLPIKQVRARLMPDHPDHLPNQAYPLRQGGRRYPQTRRLVDPAVLAAWMEQHQS